MDQLNSGMGKGSPPTVYADGGSVVEDREITNVNNINCNYVTGGDPGPSRTGNAAGQFPQADITATGGSVVSKGKISNVKGDVNISVNTSRGGAGRAAGTPPSSQVPDSSVPDVVPMEQ